MEGIAASTAASLEYAEWPEEKFVLGMLQCTDITGGVGGARRAVM